MDLKPHPRRRQVVRLFVPSPTAMGPRPDSHRYVGAGTHDPEGFFATWVAGETPGPAAPTQGSEPAPAE